MLTSVNTVEMILPTLRLTQPQKSRGYAALTNHLKLILLSAFDEKSLAENRLKNEVNDGKKKKEVRSQADRSNLFPVNHYAMQSEVNFQR